MDTKTKYKYITTKILTIFGILTSILLLWSLLVIALMYRGLIETNDSKTKYNILSFNKNWTNKR